MSDLDELYQEVLLEHSQQPSNSGVLGSANRKAEGYNPLCGDRVTVYLDVQSDTVKDISFEIQGCAICTASASLMSEEIKGKTVTDIDSMFSLFHTAITDLAAEPDQGKLGNLGPLMGVRKFPVRVKCATLPWHALQDAIKSS